MTTLRERCIHNVARDIARLARNHNLLPQAERFAAWAAATKAALPEAEAKINAMTNVELLDVIAEELQQERDN